MRGKMKNRRRQRGQGMTEYIIIVAVVAVLSIAVITQFGDRIRAMFFNTTATVAGSDERVSPDLDSDVVERDLSELEGGS